MFCSSIMERICPVLNLPTGDGGEIGEIKWQWIFPEYGSWNVCKCEKENAFKGSALEIWWNQHHASLFHCYKCWVHSSFFFCRKTLKRQPNCTRERQKSRMAIIHMGSRSCHAGVQAVTLIPLLNWLWIPNKINWMGLFIIRMKTWIMRKFSKTLNGCIWLYCFLIGFPYWKKSAKVIHIKPPETAHQSCIRAIFSCGINVL